MRRIGAACETAQRLVPPFGTIERFSTERQKFCVAFFSSPRFHPLSTLIAPFCRRTSSGFWPRPATVV